MPASGAGGKNFPKPDIIAGNGHKFYAFEVKITNSEKIYLYDFEIQELIDFSEKFGCTPLVAVKFPKKSREWKFFKVSDLEKTIGGNYKIEYKTDFPKGTDFKSLL